MFGKSLKHEFHAVSRVVTPILVALLAISLLLGIGFVVDGRLLSPSDDVHATVVSPVSSFVLLEIFLFLGFFGLMIALSVTVFVMMFRRFYTSFFTDEGYLTFTLPVSVDCHLMTKIVSMVIWHLLSSVAMVLAILIMLGGLELGYGGVISELVEELRMVLDNVSLAMLFDIMGVSGVSVVLICLSAPISMLLEILVVYFGIAIGCMLTKKYRVIVSLGCIMGVNAVMSSMQSFATAPLAMVSLDDDLLFAISLAISLVISVVCLIVSYMGTKWVLTKRLNLD